MVSSDVIDHDNNIASLSFQFFDVRFAKGENVWVGKIEWGGLAVWG